jgi:proline dehydrogenase
VSSAAALRRRLESRAAAGYVAGPDLEDAVGVARRLHANGTACTLGYWDGPGAPASLAGDALRRTVEQLAAPGPALDAVIAVKVPALETADAHDAARLVLRDGRRLIVDAPAPVSADRALALALSLTAEGCDAAIALPGRWSRATSDAVVAAAGGLAVRVVKGEWVDPDHPELDPAAGFLAVVDRLAGSARHVGVASHDPAVVGPALRRLVDAGTPCELELLLGLPTKPVAALARELGVGIRAYVPWGTSAWVPYDASTARSSARIARRLACDVALGRRRWGRTLAV